jgi:hypothetical protein
VIEGLPTAPAAGTLLVISEPRAGQSTRRPNRSGHWTLRRVWKLSGPACAPRDACRSMCPGIEIIPLLSPSRREAVLGLLIEQSGNSYQLAVGGRWCRPTAAGRCTARCSPTSATSHRPRAPRSSPAARLTGDPTPALVQHLPRSPKFRILESDRLQGKRRTPFHVSDLWPPIGKIRV